MPRPLAAAIPWLLAPLAFAQAPRPFPAEPVLVFTTDAADSSGSSTLHFVSTRCGASPMALCTAATPLGARHRLDRDRVLLAVGDALQVADLTTRQVRLLVARGTFVTQRDREVLHLDASGDGILWATTWRGTGGRRALDDERLSQVVLGPHDQAVVVTADERHVRVVDLRRGGGRTVCQLPAGSHRVRIAVAPNGRRAAIGCVDTTGRGSLRVHALDGGAELAAFHGLPIDVAPFADDVARLEVAFVDDDRVVCSETRHGVHVSLGDFVHVTRSLRPGEAARECVYAGIGSRHELPSPPAPAPSGWLRSVERDGQQLLLREGHREPLCVLPCTLWQPRQLWIAPDGRSAVAQGQDTAPRLFTLDEPAGRALATGQARDVTWLPATK